MGSTKQLPCSEFWRSAETRKVIVQALNAINVEVPSDVEPWQFMVTAMEKFHKEESVDCSYCLFQFVDLFLVYGSRLEKRWGPDWAEIPAKALRKDNQSLAFLRFLEEALALDRFRAHLAFRTTMSTKGLRFKMPGGQKGLFKSRDFGVEFLIGLTAKIDASLSKERKAENLEAKVSDTEERSRMPLVILDWVGKDRVSLLFNKKKVELTPSQSKLLYCLMRAEGLPVGYELLWKVVYGIPYESVDTGPPEALKTHKKDINKFLREEWGPPPRGRGWIDTQKNSGYLLNPSVKWQHAKEAKTNTPLFFQPSRDIDNSRQRHDDD